MRAPTKSTEAGNEDTVLPPGQRDSTGFWSPEGCSDPKTLVRPRRRRRDEPVEDEIADDVFPDPAN